MIDTFGGMAILLLAIGIFAGFMGGSLLPLIVIGAVLWSVGHFVGGAKR
jgi:hypothetical protein